ncbi:MAG: Gx transporter family protein [Tissierellia bacterium]|nr:Gx transporter family protein [Tissierellia bacterium]
MSKMRKIIFLSLLTSMGLALGVLESSIPIPIPLPGARLGLSNMVILITMVLFGFKEAIIVSVLKSVLLMLVTGSVTGFMYSIAGALFSTVGMAVSYRLLYGKISLIGVSLIGAALHNFAQVTVAVLILGKLRIYAYLPMLLLLGIATGCFVGLSSTYISEKLTKTLMLQIREKK